MIEMTQSNIRQDPVQDDAGSNVPARGADISVIIVSWNVRSHLAHCLKSLFSGPVSDGLHLEVIVVDNASTDGSAEAVGDFPGYPDPERNQPRLRARQ